MPQSELLVAEIFLTVDDTPTRSSEMQCLTEAVVDQHSHLPDMFTLRFYDSELKLLDNRKFDLTRKIKIEAVKSDGAKVTLIEGEIYALEPEFDEGMSATLVVRGYDKSYRLYRQFKSRAHQNKKDSDLAEEIARAAGLKAQVEKTSIVYDHIYQSNQSDLSFLMQRARRIGYECFVSEGKLYFRKPPSETAALTLTWGEDLLSFQPCMSLAEQVDEVIVKGWDVDKQAPIIGRAEQGALYPRIQEEKDGAAWAHAFGDGRHVIAHQPVVNQAEADILATALLDEISGSFVQARGVAYRRPDIKVGRVVKINSLGKRFSGDYLITRATHIYSSDGLKTVFYVQGTRSGLLIDEISRGCELRPWSGVVTAVVTNTNDPKGWGRVKLKFPWMAEDAESDWARLATVGGGPECGLAAIPAVGDEVVVAFAHGDFSQPFVLGGLWNGKHKLPPEMNKIQQGEKPLVRSWRSRGGHSIVMHDVSKKIEIKTAGGYVVTLDDKNKNVTISGPGQLKICMDQDITLEGKASLKIKATGAMTLESSQKLSLKAPQVTLEGTASATLKAANVTVEGSALTEVKAALVKIN
jgi:phage protein D